MTILYRVFPHLEYAEQFLAGKIRMGNLRYYSNMEDAVRGDASEGHAHHREMRPDRTAVYISKDGAREVPSPGEVSVRTDCGNDVFICCFTLPPKDPAAWSGVRKAFGEVVVQVDDAERLRDEIYAALDSTDPWQRAAPVQLWPVEYSKGGDLAPSSPLRADSVRRAVAQKSPQYAYQYEHRLALLSYGTWQTDGRPPDHIWIGLRHGLSYARIVNPDELCSL